MDPSSSSTGFFSGLFRGASSTPSDCVRSTQDITARSTESSVALSTEYTSIGRKIREGFTPFNGHQQIYTAQQRLELLEIVEGEQIHLTTHDGIKLDAVWSPSRDGIKNSPTVVLFHGNACTLDSMRQYIKWYHDRGINVLALTLRGYPGIDENPAKGDAVKQGELGFYYDVEAAMRYLLVEQKVNKESLYSLGYSLGGVLAAAAGLFFDIFVTLDHTLLSAAKVMGNIEIAKNYLPKCIISGFANGAFPKGEVDTIKEKDRLPGSMQLKTDALDSMSKIGAMRKPFFVFYGSEDHIMPPHFADDFYACRYGNPPSETKPMERKAYMEQRDSVLAEVPGGHWGPFMNHPEAERKYEIFLVNHGLMHKKYFAH